MVDTLVSLPPPAPPPPCLPPHGAGCHRCCREGAPTPPLHSAAWRVVMLLWEFDAAERALFRFPLQLRPSALPALPATRTSPTKSRQPHPTSASARHYRPYLVLFPQHAFPFQGQVFHLSSRAGRRPEKRRHAVRVDYCCSSWSQPGLNLLCVHVLSCRTAAMPWGVNDRFELRPIYCSDR